MTTFEENRGLARTYIPGLIEVGFSATKSLGFLQKKKLGYKKTDFLADWREIGGFEKKKDTFKYIRKGYKPDVKTITEAPENLSKTYSYVAEVGVQSRITGELKYHQWRLPTDDLVSIEEAEQGIWEEVEKEGSPDPDYEYLSVHIVGCKKQLVL